MNEIEILQEALRYPERKRQGQEFSDTMMARLVILGNNLLKAGLPLSLVKQIKGLIHESTKATRIELNEGLWYSAEREAEKMTINQELETLINQYNLPIDQQGIIDEVVLRIQKAITELY